MTRNLGKIRLERQMIDNRPYGIPYAAGTNVLWKDHTEEKSGHIYLVVDGDGAILAAGPDPAWNLVEGFDIWEVEGEDYQSVVGKHWNGTTVE